MLILTAEILIADYLEKPFEAGDTVQIYFDDSYDKTLEDGSHHILLLGAIRIYQNFLSPAQGHVCNFTPSCSNYMFKAVRKYGIISGIVKGMDRLQRCNYGARNYLGLYYSDIVIVQGRGYRLIDEP